MVGHVFSPEAQSALVTTLFETQNGLNGKAALLAEVLQNWYPQDREQILATTMGSFDRECTPSNFGGSLV